MSLQLDASNVHLTDAYRVVTCEFGVDRTVVVAKSPIEADSCPFCNGRDIKKWGVRDLVCLDVPRNGKPVEIRLSVQRYRCRSCARTFSQPLPGVSDTRCMTQRLLLWIGGEGQVRSFTSIAADIGSNEATVRRAFGDYVRLLELATRTNAPTHMAVVTLQVLNAQRVAIFNAKARTLVDVLAKNDDALLHSYLSSLRERGVTQFVSVESEEIYRVVTNALPDAVVFIDRSYVVGMLSRAVLIARETTKSKLAKSLLLKTTEALTGAESARLHTELGRRPALAHVCQARDAILAIYAGMPRPDIARRDIEFAIDAIPREQKVWFNEFIEAWKALREPLLGYFVAGAIGASSDRLGDLSEVERILSGLSRGYSFDALRVSLLREAQSAKEQGLSDGVYLDRLGRS